LTSPRNKTLDIGHRLCDKSLTINISGGKMKKILILMTLIAISAGACKKSVAGQTSQWTNALKDLDEQSTQYPNIKPLLQAKATEAKAIYAEAEKLSDEEQKAEKIAAAISKVRENLGVMTEIRTKLNSVDATIKKITEYKTTKDRAKRATAEIQAIRTSQDEIEKALSALKPASGEELNTKVRELIGQVISISGRADRTLKSVKGK